MLCLLIGGTVFRAFCKTVSPVIILRLAQITISISLWDWLLIFFTVEEKFGVPKIQAKKGNLTHDPIPWFICPSILGPTLCNPQKRKGRDFPGGPAVRNPPSNAGDSGSIPGRGTGIPRATGQLILRTTTTELACHNYRAHTPWSQRATTREEKTHRPQLERRLRTTTKSPRASTRGHMPQQRSRVPQVRCDVAIKKKRLGGQSLNSSPPRAWEIWTGCAALRPASGDSWLLLPAGGAVGAQSPRQKGNVPRMPCVSPWQRPPLSGADGRRPHPWAASKIVWSSAAAPAGHSKRVPRAQPRPGIRPGTIPGVGSAAAPRVSGYADSASVSGDLSARQRGRSAVA